MLRKNGTAIFEEVNAVDIWLLVIGTVLIWVLGLLACKLLEDIVDDWFH